MGTLLLVLAVVVIGGGAGYYFKIYRPKHSAGHGSEYEEYEDGGTEPDSAADAWEDADDGPPWDEDDAREEYETDNGEDEDA